MSHIDQSWYIQPQGIRVRTAAGGVVLRHDGKEWLIALAREAEFTDYVLPKGGVERGETLEEAARRETTEETGIADLTLVGELGSLSRLDFKKTRWITVHYFIYTTRQVEAQPTDHVKHPHPPEWFPVNHPPGMFWPEQLRLLEERRDVIVAMAERSLAVPGR